MVSAPLLFKYAYFGFLKWGVAFVVASAEAAVNAVVDRGVVDRKKIAVGGHSYGAFMAANLAAHCPELFACGIARSGAYNRTLTPFSFQEEQRTLWKAKDTYMTMSPFMMADKIKIPMLLIHGAEDNNPGTVLALPLVSSKLYVFSHLQAMLDMQIQFVESLACTL